MGPEILVAVLGPVVGTLFGGIVFLQRRTITAIDQRIETIAEQLDEVHDQVTEIRVSLPERYTTKDEFINHVRTEERWQQEVLSSIRELREEVIVLRVQGHQQ